MKRLIPLVAAVVAVGACQKGDQNAASDGRGADTNVTTREVQDTTIVTHDTTVRVDTMVKRGGAAVPDSAARARRP